MLEIDGKSIYMTRGDSAPLKIVPYVKDTETQEKHPYILEQGDRVVFRLKMKADDSYPVVCEKECQVDPINNEVTLLIEPEDTASCEFKKYRYEMELITTNNFHSTFIEDEDFTIGKELEEHG